MRGGFSLIEIILSLIITSILSISAFKALEALYLRSARTQAISRLSLRSQIVLDQISSLLYQRVPGSAIGYQPGCEALRDASSSHKILEWLRFDEDGLMSGEYDGFVDMEGSDPSVQLLDTNVSLDHLSDYNLIFSGSFDSAAMELPACKGAFGWHGNDSNLSFDIDKGDNGKIKIIDSIPPKYIYEKYYLSSGALAVARSADINQSASCIDNNLSHWQKNDSTLLLFYGYRPWKGETFCADQNDTLNHAGSVTIISEHVAAFRAKYINKTIRLFIEMNQSIPSLNSPVHLSKQKGVF